ncbi:MAG: hypothetical protein A3J59_01680 [Candidatus Buchananbacteria bacterium RIFCSPHIGHO2_02_FULL_56_16]|uniref:Uncharacterized protein n=1 Tax=Candidatus Buchananbacteria bacterium RIFCSPHIGHO2_02_FULL_56_16 TaxID=1797542 RepID=A0A1G1YFC9_9BACT|nr:MAG: hypothetical protein A3J59_01680 [Candidatus Buchananbacteria bacterium RIFCSPHIGHO2_02_FULL_56_16]
MDVHCCNCGESWEDYFLRHDLQAEEEQAPGTLAAHGWRFGKRSRSLIFHCPRCPKDGSGLPDAEKRMEALQLLADLLGEGGYTARTETFALLFFYPSFRKGRQTNESSRPR